ncbi:hypothetical protein niasHT_036757 [Heterodera trifolii]|uniref:Uncharacterized protein n=1 Tax=Heterodera trifolii TaxID=157864 RepID=A0ABD2IUY2_9BILA
MCPPSPLPIQNATIPPPLLSPPLFVNSPPISHTLPMCQNPRILSYLTHSSHLLAVARKSRPGEVSPENGGEEAEGRERLRLRRRHLPPITLNASRLPAANGHTRKGRTDDEKWQDEMGWDERGGERREGAGSSVGG